MNAPDYRQQEELEGMEWLMEHGLVDRLRNGGQPDLADMAERVVGALEEALEFLEGSEDIRDGSDGQQLPNDAMILASQIRDTLATVRSRQ